MRSCCTPAAAHRSSFSALQRAEIAEIPLCTAWCIAFST